MELLMGWIDLGLSNQMTPILARPNCLTHHLVDLEPQFNLISLGHSLLDTPNELDLDLSIVAT